LASELGSAADSFSQLGRFPEHRLQQLRHHDDGIGNHGTNNSGFGNVGIQDLGAFNEADIVSGIFNF
jgi:hypothetical protein